MCAFDIGSDIGGSIRNPAHFCGVYGHKASFGVIPFRGGRLPKNFPLPIKDHAVAGPLARTAEDLALVMGVLSGPDEEDLRPGPGWQLVLPPPRHTSLAKFRVAVVLQVGSFPADRGVLDVLERMVRALRSKGVEVDERPVMPFSLHDSWDLFQRLLVVSDANDNVPEDTYRCWEAEAEAILRARKRARHNLDFAACPGRSVDHLLLARVASYYQFSKWERERIELRLKMKRFF